MSNPFLVINRSNRRILHEAATLTEARGFSEGCKQLTAIAMLPQLNGRSEWMYCFQTVNSDTGEIIAESAPMDFDEAVDIFYAIKTMLIPACVAIKGGAR